MTFRQRSNSIYPICRPTSLIGLLLGCLTLLAACGGNDEDQSRPADESNSQNQPDAFMVATILPLYDLARQVTGDAVTVELILPAGRSPHGYELTPSDRIKIRNATILIKAGGGVDSWIEKAAHHEAETRNLQLLDLLDLIDSSLEHESRPEPDPEHSEQVEDDHQDQHEHEHSAGLNPHQWLVPTHAKMFIAKLLDLLIIQNPDHAAGFIARAADVTARLDELDHDFQTALGEIPDRRIITFHDAFDPLAEAYNIDVVASVFSVESQQLTPRDLQRVENLVKEQGVRAIFIEPQFAATASLARQLEGVAILRTLDPLGAASRSGTEPATYFTMMQNNLTTLVAGLEENIPPPENESGG